MTRIQELIRVLQWNTIPAKYDSKADIIMSHTSQHMGLTPLIAQIKQAINKSVTY